MLDQRNICAMMSLWIIKWKMARRLSQNWESQNIEFQIIVNEVKMEGVNLDVQFSRGQYHKKDPPFSERLWNLLEGKEGFGVKKG